MLRVLSLVLLSALPAAAEEPAPTPPPVEVKHEFIRRNAVVRLTTVRVGARRFSRRELCPPGIPSWALSRMVIHVPNGTPQPVYRAPSADWCSPDF